MSIWRLEEKVCNSGVSARTRVCVCVVHLSCQLIFKVKGKIYVTESVVKYEGAHTYEG